jgi:hypothetical protein
MSVDFEGFFRALCDYRSSIRTLFGLSALVLILQIPYLLFTNPGGTLFVLSVLNIAGAAPVALLSALALRRCRSRRKESM